MAQHTDPVCGMVVDPGTAAGKSTYQGTTYYFCSAQCLREFENNPTRYLGVTQETAAAADSANAAAKASQAPGTPDAGLERHEPPLTKTGWLVAPKFGSAGSGGAEYERLPEAHDDQLDEH